MSLTNHHATFPTVKADAKGPLKAIEIDCVDLCVTVSALTLDHTLSLELFHNRPF